MWSDRRLVNQVGSWQNQVRQAKLLLSWSFSAFSAALREARFFNPFSRQDAKFAKLKSVFWDYEHTICNHILNGKPSCQ